jgi:hypothetical protein
MKTCKSIPETKPINLDNRKSIPETKPIIFKETFNNRLFDSVKQGFGFEIGSSLANNFVSSLLTKDAINKEFKKCKINNDCPIKLENDFDKYFL